MSVQIKNDLTQKAVAETSMQYLGKLRKHYRFDETHLKEMLPDHFHPFAIQ